MRKIPFEISKFAQGITKCVYRDGKEAHVVRIDSDNPQPILTANRNKKLFRHYADGIHQEDKRESEYDLFTVLERIIRTWTYDEVPNGAVIRYRGVAGLEYKIVAKSEYNVILESKSEGILGKDQKTYSIGQLTDYWEYSLDDGKTWAVCGVVVQ